MYSHKKCNNTVAFVMPHKMGESHFSIEHLENAVNSVIGQSDSDWVLIIVDDYSQNRKTGSYLNDIEESYKGKIIVLHTDRNVGAGEARNIGIREAAKRGAPFVLFIDDDDISDSNRLAKTRQLFDSDKNTNVVYSSFIVIDELGRVVDKEKISPSVRDILDGHEYDVVDGINAWIPIATIKNYTNLTSCTAVRTELAIKEPFPAYRVSEDSNTWLRYGAYPGAFRFISNMKNYYRVCTGTASRSRSEITDFYQQKALAEVAGFEKASEISRRYGLINIGEVFRIKVRFLIRLSLSMLYGGEIGLAKEYILQAYGMSKSIADNTVYGLRFMNNSFRNRFEKIVFEVKNEKEPFR